MKKVDILVIILVLLISSTFYFLYFNNYSSTGDKVVQILYKNQVVYETDLKQTTNVIVEITSKDQILYVKIDDTIKTYPISSNVEILNNVSITSEEIRMIEANCKNKYCYNMRLGKGFSSPIVCTNGILVRLVSDEFYIGV